MSGSYETGLAAVAAALELELEAIGALVQGAAAAQETLVTLEEALPRLVSALRAAVEGVARLDPPPDLAGEHELLLAGLQEIVALEEELATRVEAGDAAGALARVEAIAARQARLEASLSATMLTAAGAVAGGGGGAGLLAAGAEGVSRPRRRRSCRPWMRSRIWGGWTSPARSGCWRWIRWWWGDGADHGAVGGAGVGDGGGGAGASMRRRCGILGRRGSRSGWGRGRMGR